MFAWHSSSKLRECEQQTAASEVAGRQAGMPTAQQCKESCGKEGPKSTRAAGGDASPRASGRRRRNR
ncbi:unnamed protein product [Sphagnum jensenii]|uniref:Uncharacterized protein n=1 Tax=Sphagnum jensenii TaxID=128206 RepID=A0ABP0WZ83_9BRYO